jgi:cephalosporin hydroxylase
MSLFSRQKKIRWSDIVDGHYKVTYKGVPALKCPFDYVMYQMIVCEVKPDLIVEIGTNKGGSTLYLADLLELANKGEIHTIDLENNEEDSLLHRHPRVRVFKNGFRQYDLGPMKNFSTILVIDDGSHMYKDALDALAMFSPFVSKGSYFIVEDGIVTDLNNTDEYHGGPQKAIDEFIQTNPDFIIDNRWCDFFGPSSTFNVKGYLKKVDKQK